MMTAVKSTAFGLNHQKALYRVALLQESVQIGFRLKAFIIGSKIKQDACIRARA